MRKFKEDAIQQKMQNSKRREKRGRIDINAWSLEEDAKSAPVGALSIEDQVVTFLANLFFLPTRRIRYFLVAGDIKTVKVGDFSFH